MIHEIASLQNCIQIVSSEPIWTISGANFDISLSILDTKLITNDLDKLNGTTATSKLAWEVVQMDKKK